MNEEKIKKQSNQQSIKLLQLEVRKHLANGNLKSVSDTMDKLNRLREA